MQLLIHYDQIFALIVKWNTTIHTNFVMIITLRLKICTIVFSIMLKLWKLLRIIAWNFYLIFTAREVELRLTITHHVHVHMYIHRSMTAPTYSAHPLTPSSASRSLIQVSSNPYTRHTSTIEFRRRITCPELVPGKPLFTDLVGERTASWSWVGVAMVY